LSKLGGTQYPEFGGPLWIKSGSYSLLFCNYNKSLCEEEIKINYLSSWGDLDPTSELRKIDLLDELVLIDSFFYCMSVVGVWWW
jgi:hypothetical protein